MSQYGLQGFDERLEPDFAAGSVFGARWWKLELPDVLGTDVRLAGVHGAWTAGENTASCAFRSLNHNHYLNVPDEQCACGFWAYWEVPPAPNPHRFTIPILGVIEGYGRTLIGDRGFRCARARIRGLHFPAGAAGLLKTDPCPRDFPLRPRFRTDAAIRTWRELAGQNDPQPMPPDDDRAIARLAELETALEDAYGVPVYASRDLMLQRHPLTRDYLPEITRPVRGPLCGWGWNGPHPGRSACCPHDSCWSILRDPQSAIVA